MRRQGRPAGERIGPYYTWNNDLAKARVKAGLTQSEFAIRAGVSERTVREHEKEQWPNARQRGRDVHARLLATLAGLARSPENGRIGR